MTVNRRCYLSRLGGVREELTGVAVTKVRPGQTDNIPQATPSVLLLETQLSKSAGSS